MDLLLAATLIALHTVDGNEVLINPAHITMLRPSTEAQGRERNTLVTRGVRCVVSLSDGKFVSVVEECSTIRQALDTTQRNEPGSR